MDQPTVISRKNSITSISTTNSTISNQASINNSRGSNSSIRNISTNNLLSIDDKFVKRNMKRSQEAKFHKTPQGAYYFPNGEVFRPRGAPQRRNRPNKIQNPPPRENDHAIPRSAVPPQVSHQQAPGQMANGHIARSPSIDSMSSITANIPRSYSANNMRKLQNHKSLAQSLRTTKADTPTNISLFQQHLSQQHQQHQPGQLPQQYSQQFQQFQQFQMSGNAPVQSHNQSPKLQASQGPKLHANQSPKTQYHPQFPPAQQALPQTSHQLYQHQLLHSNNSSSSSLKNLQSNNLIKNLSILGPKSSDARASIESNSKSDSNLSSFSGHTLNRSTSNTPQTSVSIAEDEKEVDSSRPSSAGEESLSILKESKDENDENIIPQVAIHTPDTESIEEFSTPLNLTPVQEHGFITNSPSKTFSLNESKDSIGGDQVLQTKSISTVSSVYSSISESSNREEEEEGNSRPQTPENPPFSSQDSFDNHNTTEEQELTPTATIQLMSPKDSPATRSSKLMEVFSTPKQARDSIVDPKSLPESESSTQSSSFPSPTSSRSEGNGDLDDLLNDYQSESPLSKPPRMPSMGLASNMVKESSDPFVESGEESESHNSFVASAESNKQDMPSPTVSNTFSDSQTSLKKDTPATLLGTSVEEIYDNSKSNSIEAEDKTEDVHLADGPGIDKESSMVEQTEKEEPKEVPPKEDPQPVIDKAFESVTDEKSKSTTETKPKSMLDVKPKSMLDVGEKAPIKSMLDVGEVSITKTPSSTNDKIPSVIPLQLEFESPQKESTSTISEPQTPTKSSSQAKTPDISSVSIDGATEDEIAASNSFGKPVNKPLDKSLPSTPSSKGDIETSVRNSKSLSNVKDKKSLWNKVLNKMSTPADSRSNSFDRRVSLDKKNSFSTGRRSSSDINSVRSMKPGKAIGKLNDSSPANTNTKTKKISSSKRSFSFKDLKISSFSKKEKAPPLPVMPVQEPKVEPVLPEPEPILEELTLTKLPSFEADDNMFDDMLNTFDKELERVGRKPTIKPKTFKVTEPFLQDDELTRDQIEDQQIKDKVSGNHSRSNSEDYIDENLEFLREAIVWPIDFGGSDIKSVVSAEEEAPPSVKPVASNESEELVGGEEDVFHIDKEQLNNLFNNISNSQRRRLPMHLKYIEQFKDYQVLQINVKRFENLTNSELVIHQEGDHKVASILRKNSRYGTRSRGTLNSRDRIPQSTPKAKPKVQFSNKISINETFSPDLYSRYNRSVTQYNLTEPIQIVKIKNELNEFKCNEMLVHEQSQNNTHFFY